MEVIKIDADKVKIIETTETVFSIEELKQEIASLQECIDKIQNLSYPENCTDGMKTAIDEYNQKKEAERYELENQKIIAQNNLGLCQ